MNQESPDFFISQGLFDYGISIGFTGEDFGNFAKWRAQRAIDGIKKESLSDEMDKFLAETRTKQ